MDLSVSDAPVCVEHSGTFRDDRKCLRFRWWNTEKEIFRLVCTLQYEVAKLQQSLAVLMEKLYTFSGSKLSELVGSLACLQGLPGLRVWLIDSDLIVRSLLVV